MELDTYLKTVAASFVGCTFAILLNVLLTAWFTEISKRDNGR